MYWTETYIKTIFHCILTDPTYYCFSNNLNEKYEFLHQTLYGVILNSNPIKIWLISNQTTCLDTCNLIVLPNVWNIKIWHNFIVCRFDTIWLFSLLKHIKFYLSRGVICVDIKFSHFLLHSRQKELEQSLSHIFSILSSLIKSLFSVFSSPCHLSLSAVSPFSNVRACVPSYISIKFYFDAI